MAHENLYSDAFPQEISKGGGIAAFSTSKCCECLIFDFGATPLGLDAKPGDPTPQGMPHWLVQNDATHPNGGSTNWQRDPSDRNTFFTSVEGAKISFGAKTPAFPKPVIPNSTTGGGYCIEFELEATGEMRMIGGILSFPPIYPDNTADLIFNGQSYGKSGRYVQQRVVSGGGTFAFDETIWPGGKRKVVMWNNSHLWIDNKRYSIIRSAGINFANFYGTTRISNFKIYETGQKGCLGPMGDWWPYKPAHSMTVGWQWYDGSPPPVPPNPPTPPPAYYNDIIAARSGNFVFTWDHTRNAWVCERNWGPWKSVIGFGPGSTEVFGYFDMCVMHFPGNKKGIDLEFRIADHPTLVNSYMKETYGAYDPDDYPLRNGMRAIDIGGVQPIDYSDMYWPKVTGTGAFYSIDGSTNGLGQTTYFPTYVYPSYISFEPTYADEE